MKSRSSFWTLSILILLVASPVWGDKDSLTRSVENNSEMAWKTALSIWEFAEPGYQEVKSSALLAKRLESVGYKIKFGVSDIPTAFTATIGSGKPVIGILGEFDALPGLAQEAVPSRAPRDGNGYGHACGHHLFGAGSMLAAVALAESIKSGDQPGTIRFYGTPAEEGGAAKVFMVREGLFDDLDAVLHWHPSDRNRSGDRSNLSRIAAKFRFYGQAAHAASAPEQGRSALDAIAIMNYSADLMREHTPDFTRIHHVITAGGLAPNVVPDFAEAYYYVRHPDATVVKDLYARLLNCAKAGALATDTRLEVEFLAGTHNLLPNKTLSRITQHNLENLTDLKFTEKETAFAEELQKLLPNPISLESIDKVTVSSDDLSMGSTDVGDVSWVVPTTGFSTACWVPGTPAHSWFAVAAGGTTIGRKGMELAAKTIASTAWDIAHDPDIVKNAKAELDKRLGEHAYSAMLEPGQKAPLNYRDPAVK